MQCPRNKLVAYLRDIAATRVIVIVRKTLAIGDEIAGLRRV